MKRRSQKRAARRQPWGGASGVRAAVVPLLFVALAVAVEELLSRTVGITPLIVFHAATAAATWLAGPLAGALCGLLGFIIGERFYFPNSLFDAFATRALVQAIVFWIASGSIITGLSVLRLALERASRGARRAERLTRSVRRRNAESRRAASRYRALNEVAASLLPAVSPSAVRELVLERGVAAADASAAVIVWHEGEGLDVRCSADMLEEVARDVASSAIVAAVLKGGDTRWVAAADLLEDMEARSGCDVWAVLPLSARERRLGVLLLGYDAAGGLTEAYRTIAELLAQQCAQALDRARLYQAERSLRVTAQFAERQMGFLALASSALSATLDTTRSLAEVADLAATNLGGFCAIHLIDREGVARLAAGSFTSETGLIRFGGDEHRYSLGAASPHGYPAVLSSGQAQLVSDITPETLDEMASSPAAASRLRELGIRSQICVPLEVRDTVLGTITLASTEPGRQLGAAELTLAEHVARRVAQAADAAQLYRTAVQASRSKSSFLAVMSHELRTPLNAILGYADLILMGVPVGVTEETRHQVERIRYSATHLLELVEDVLNFARVDAGRDRVQIETVRLDEVVGEAVGMVQPLAAGKGLELRRRVPEGATMNTDRAKLVRILHNLLSNATKFTASGSVEVDASIEDGQITLHVRDTGIGIARENRERIFDPFWQVEQTPTRRHGGTGIGLGVARQLARLLGGDLTVESEVGRGSTFTLRLPLRYEALPPATV